MKIVLLQSVLNVMQKQKWENFHSSSILIHIKCYYCTSCDLIITKQSELEHLLATGFSQINSNIIGNNYLVIGTVDRKDWREGNEQQIEPAETIKKMYVFKDVWNFEVIPAGWYPESKWEKHKCQSYTGCCPNNKIKPFLKI